MDKLISLVQLAMSIFMFSATVVGGVAHLIKGTIGGFGIIGVLFIVSLMYVLVREFYREYKQEYK